MAAANTVATSKEVVTAADGVMATEEVMAMEEVVVATMAQAGGSESTLAGVRVRKPRWWRTDYIICLTALALTCAPLLANASVGLTRPCGAPHSQVDPSGASEPQGGTISGLVMDTAETPLRGVGVRIPQLGRNATTDENGSYRISELPPGTYTIVFSLPRYFPMTYRVTISGGKTRSLDVVLEPATLETQTVTVTATPYVEDLLRTSADVDVLAGREKLAQQTPALGGSLEKMPGVWSISTGSQVGKPVIRGLSSNRIRVLTDGISMDYQQYGVRHWPSIDPFGAERIEVVRGVSSILYGSDAIGGAVNVIPSHIPDAVGKTPFLSGRAAGQFYSNNTEIMGGAHLAGAVGGFGFTGNMVRRSAGNLTVPDVRTAAETGVATDPKFTGELEFTDYDQFSGGLGVGYRGNRGRVTARYFRWHDQHNFLMPDGSGLGQHLTNNLLQVKGVLFPGGNWIVRPSFTYANNLRLSNMAGSPRDRMPEDVVIDMEIDSYTGRLEIEHGTMRRVAGQFGVDYTYEDQVTRGIVPLLPSATIHNVAGFVYESVDLGRFGLTLGARFDRRGQKAEPNATLRLPDIEAGESLAVCDRTYNVLSGALGGTYRLTPESALAWNIGRGFRAPSIFELHAFGVHGGIAAFQIGDPNLEPEISLNTDVSVRWRSPRLLAKATLYRNAIDNYVYLVNAEAIDPYTHLPIMRATQADAVLWGADLSARAQILPWLQLRGIFETVDGENVETGDKLPLLPATRLEGGIRYTWREWGRMQSPHLDFGVRHVLRKQAAGRFEPFWQFDANPDFGVASTEAYTLLDIGVGFDLPLAQEYVHLDFRIENLLDEVYRDFLDTYKGYALSLGRNVSVMLSVPFRIK